MGLLTDLLIASPQEAASVCTDAGRARKWPCLEFTGLDNAKLAALAGAMGLPDEAAQLEGSARVVFMQGKEGPWVFHLPETMRDALAKLAPAAMPEVAERWAKDPELTLDGWAAEDLPEGLEMLRAFATKARQSNGQLLLWMSL